MVLFYLFLPVAVIVAFSFNDPVGKFNFVWKGFSLDAWKDPFKYPALVDALEESLKVAAVGHGHRRRARLTDRHRPGPAPVPRARAASTSSWSSP